MKRFLSILTAVVLLACLGCGGDRGKQGVNSGKDMPKPEKPG